MKHYLEPIFALTAIALLATTSVQAETDLKMVIALKTDDFELTETDISTLAIGEAQTIETESGKVIDILRTADGAEIYVDGELLEMNFDNENLHEQHKIRKHVEVVCADGDECNKTVFVLNSDDNAVLNWVGEDGDNVIIHEEIELTCTDEDEGTSCSDKLVWVSDTGNIDLEELHEMHAGQGGHKVIVIKKEIVTED